MFVELMTRRRIGRARVREGPNWVPRHWDWEWGKIRLPDAGASMTEALKGDKIWLPDACSSVSLALIHCLNAWNEITQNIEV
jgi:hypothetical protein